MGFELGPKPLRRPPRGWLPARAFALRHSVSDPPTGPEPSETIVDTIFVLTVTWRVEIDGREPYELDEVRHSPTWTLTGPLGAGNRWYKVRVRPTYGLMPELGVPCVVDPSDRTQLWIDWDASYAEHMPEVAAKWAPPPPDPVVAGEQTELMRRIEDMTRIQRDGVKARATVLAREDTDRRFGNVPVILLTLQLEDGRSVVFEHVYGPRHAKHYKPGREIDVWIDPEGAICPGR